MDTANFRLCPSFRLISDDGSQVVFALLSGLEHRLDSLVYLRLFYKFEGLLDEC
jgi:hypothetical protein